MAQTECHPGPKKCARCFTSAARKNVRYRQIIAWRNAQNAANAKNYRAWQAYKNGRYVFYRSKHYAVQVKALRRKQAYVRRVVAGWVKTMNYKYNNCK
jgi:hypothetical protein